MNDILGPEPDSEVAAHERDASVIGGSIGRRQPKPDRRAVVGSLAAHGGILLMIWISGIASSRTPEFEVYRVKLYSPPAQVEAVEAAPVALSTPIRAPRTAEVIPEKPKPPTPTPKPKPQVVEPPREEKPKPKTPEAVEGPRAKPDSPGGENIDVNIEGEAFPYPDYLSNIILQLNRHFRWSGSPNLQNTIVFYINRDGSIGGIKVLERSGDFNFDLQVTSAVEQAGRRGAFGPLPDGWVQDRLWVRFTFLPPG
jgi:outer membrane biosynthesis protein TonB